MPPPRRDCKEPFQLRGDTHADRKGDPRAWQLGPRRWGMAVRALERGRPSAAWRRLSACRAGYRGELFEKAAAIRELGVGINLLPHAARSWPSRPARAGRRHRRPPRELIYCNRLGQRIWAEPRGLEGGPPGRILDQPRPPAGTAPRGSGTAARQPDHLGICWSTSADAEGRPGTFAARRCVTAAWHGDPDRADGIHSAAGHAPPGEGPPRWNGHLLWRGCGPGRAVPGGATMIIAATSTRRSCFNRSPGRRGSRPRADQWVSGPARRRLDTPPRARTGAAGSARRGSADLAHCRSTVVESRRWAPEHRVYGPMCDRTR